MAYSLMNTLKHSKLRYLPCAAVPSVPSPIVV